MSASGAKNRRKKVDDLACQVDKLNFKCKGFTALLGRIYANDSLQVAALHKSRLCLFGSPLVEWVLEKDITYVHVTRQAVGKLPLTYVHLLGRTLLYVFFIVPTSQPFNVQHPLIAVLIKTKIIIVFVFTKTFFSDPVI